MTDPQVVLLTGASRGIGAHTAIWLADGGAALALVSRNEAALALVGTAARQRGAEVLELPGDITAPGMAERTIAAVVARFGHLDALINNAGIVGPIGHVTDLELAGWERTFTTNVYAPIAFIRAAAPELRQRFGRVVNVTSEVADGPAESIGPYAASKAALRHVTGTLAHEEDSITAIAYDPGPCDTDLMTEIRGQADARMTAAMATAYRDMHSSGRLVRPIDTARVLAWLAACAPPSWSGRVIDHTDVDAVAAATETYPDRD